MKLIKDIFLAVIIVAVALVAVYLESDYAKTNSIESYKLISGTLHKKGVKELNKDSKAYFVKIKNESGDYTLLLPTSEAPEHFFKRVRTTKNAEARVIRTFRGIHLIELKINGKYALRQIGTKPVY